MMPQDEKVTPKNANPAVSGEDEEAVPNHTGMKLLVLGLGIAILGMVGLMVYKISQKAAESLMGDDPTQVAVEAPVVAPVLSYGDFRVERPAGATLVGVSTQGAEMVFHFRSNEGDTIITLNRKTGEQAKVEIPLAWQE